MNHKRHTNLKKRFLRLSLLIPILIISSCITSTTPKVDIPPPPKLVESVVPSLKKVSDGIDKTIETNKKIDDKIKEQRSTVLEQKLSIVETIAKVERLQEKIISDQLIKEIEILDIVTELKAIETRNLFLEKQNSELDAIRTEQEAILKMTKEDASITYKKLLDKENEANELRNQNSFLSKNLQLKNSEVEKLKTELSKEKIKAAKASVYKNWIIGLVSAFVGWVIIKNILMIYFPMTKFRI